MNFIVRNIRQVGGGFLGHSQGLLRVKRCSENIHSINYKLTRIHHYHKLG